MLPKRERVDTKGIDLLFKEGRNISSPILNFKFVLTQDIFPARISFVAPKSVAKIAVKRNLLRRRGYSALKKFISLFPLGLVGVFIFRKSIDSVLEIENEIKNIRSKIN